MGVVRKEDTLVVRLFLIFFSPKVEPYSINGSLNHPLNQILNQVLNRRVGNKIFYMLVSRVSTASCYG